MSHRMSAEWVNLTYSYRVTMAISHHHIGLKEVHK